MMLFRSLSFVALLGLLSTPAMASEAKTAEPAINMDLCRFMVAHRPAEKTKDVVSADYQAGVDVRGNPVVEADVSPQINIPDINDIVYRFNLELDVLDYLGIENTTAQKIVTNYATVMAYEGHYYISFGVNEQGAIAAYQQLLGSEQEVALQALCPKEVDQKILEKDLSNDIESKDKSSGQVEAKDQPAKTTETKQ